MIETKECKNENLPVLHLFSYLVGVKKNTPWLISFLLLTLLLWPILAFSQEVAPSTDSLRQVWQDTNLPDTSRFQARLTMISQLSDKQADTAVVWSRRLIEQVEVLGATEWIKKAEQTLSKNLILLGFNTFVAGKYTDRAKNKLATAYILEGFEIDKKYQDYVNMSRAMIALGFIHKYQEEMELALEKFETAVKYGELAKNPLALCNAVRQVGAIQMMTGDNQGALANYEKAVVLARETDVRKEVANSLNQLALLTNRMGQFEESLAYQQEALGIYLEGDTAQETVAREVSISMINFGVVLDNLGQAEASLAIYQRALNLLAPFDEKRYIAKIQQNMGLIYANQGKVQQAIESTEKALANKQAIDDQRGIVSSLAKLGDFKTREANFPEAMAYYNQALALAKEIGVHTQIISVQHNMAELYVSQGEYEQAANFFLQNIESSEQLEMPRSVATNLLALGKVKTLMGQDSMALIHLQRGLEISRSIKHKVGEGEALEALGDFHYQQRELVRAEQLYREALKCYTEIGNQLGTTTVRNQLHQLLNEAQRPVEVLEYGPQVLAMSQNLHNVEEIERAAFNLYEAYRAAGKNTLALEMYELHQQMRDSLDTESNQRAILRQRYAYAYQEQALKDSFEFAQQQAEKDLGFQQEISQRNYLIGGVLGLLIIGFLAFLLFRNQQRIRLREREMALQQERYEQARLQELDELKTRFFTNISHEFRTPLTVILGMAEQLVAPFDQERSLIRRNGRRLLRLVNQLLDLARMESQDITLNFVQGDIVSYLRYLTESFQSIAEEREISLRVETKALEIIMDYDAEKVQDIVYNLLSNALKFTPPQGEVVLKMLEEKGEAAGGVMRCSVQDTGVGIPADELPHIFDRFYQGGQIARDSSTGIGLALVKGLVARMGGEITVESEVGKGTTFSFTLPIQRVADTPAAYATAVAEVPFVETTGLPTMAEGHQADDPDRQQVLIIEDNPDVITYLSAVLGPSYNLLTAMDGTTGAKMAYEHIPDLVVCDVMMPGMDGYEVTEALKTDARTSHIPIILLTAKANQDDKVAGLVHGADAYLTKPFDRTELLVRIEKLLELRQKLQARYREMVSSGEVAAPSAELAPKAPTLDEIFLQNIRTTITENITKTDLSVHDLCEAVNLARTQVYRKLKALTGENPTLFIRSVRLAHARQLLETTELTVSEIAYDVGFSDPGYFSRVFAEAFGVRPTGFREGKK